MAANPWLVALKSGVPVKTDPRKPEEPSSLGFLGPVPGGALKTEGLKVPANDPDGEVSQRTQRAQVSGDAIQGEGSSGSDPTDNRDAGFPNFQTIPEYLDDAEGAPLPECSASGGVAGEGDDGGGVSEQSQHPDDQPKLQGLAAERHAARLHRFIAAGLAPVRALAAADRLAQRDADYGDDRRMCVECSYYGTRRRCIAAATGRLVGVARDLEPIPDLLQRCEVFGLRKGLD